MGKSKYRRSVWGLSIFLMLVLCAAVLPAAPLSANGTTVGMVIIPTPKIVTVNDTFSVNITVTVSGGAAVVGAEAHINFNNTYLEVVSIGNVTASVMASKFNNTAGTIDYAAVAGTGTSGLTTNFTLATLNLKAKVVTNATVLTFVYDGSARETSIAVEAVSGDVLNHGAVNGSVQVLPMGSLSGHLELDRASPAPNAIWSTNVSVVFFQLGTSNVVRTANVTSDNGGNFTVADIPTGYYDVGVWCRRSLSELVTNVTFAPANATAVTFGPLREGDASNDDAISGVDYASLYTYFWANSGTGLDRCDFNIDNVVNIFDYRLLWKNYGQNGDMKGKWSPPTSP